MTTPQLSTHDPRILHFNAPWKRTQYVSQHLHRLGAFQMVDDPNGYWLILATMPSPLPPTHESPNPQEKSSSPTVHRSSPILITILFAIISIAFLSDKVSNGEKISGTSPTSSTEISYVSSTIPVAEPTLIEKDFYLEIGSEGEDVKLFQSRINILSEKNEEFREMLANESLFECKEDGIYGEHTEEFTEVLQLFLGFEPTGRVDTKTWNQLALLVQEEK